MRSGDARRLGAAVGVVGVGQLLLPVVARTIVDLPGPWSGTAVMMLHSAALLVPAALLWAGIRLRAASWAVVIVGALATTVLPSTVGDLLDARSTSGGIVAFTLVLLALELATIAVAVFGVRELQFRPIAARSAAVGLAAAGAVAFGLSQLFINVTMVPAGRPRGVMDGFSTSFSELMTGPWTLTLAMAGTAVVAAAAAAAVISRRAPALAIAVALLPTTIARAINDTVIGPIGLETSALEPYAALAAGGWLNLLAMTLLLASIPLAVRTQRGRSARAGRRSFA